MVRYVLISLMIHTFTILSLLMLLNLQSQKQNYDFSNIYIKVSLNTLPKDRNFGTKTKNNSIDLLLQERIDNTQQNNSENNTKQDNTGYSDVVSTNNFKITNEFYDEQLNVNYDSQEMIPPKVIYTPNISYPVQAKIMKIEGSVMIEVTISKDGKVINPKIIESSGYQILDNSALEYVKNILFSPARDVNGVPVEVKSTYIVHFVLR
ncbi:MAG: energy transducer TonB [Brevinematia bacterium]